MGADKDSILAFLKIILGSENVYFQPPPKFLISYPCITFFIDNLQAQHANNGVYSIDTAYSVIFISREPETSIVYKLAALPKSNFDRHYISDLLHHFVFTIFF